MGLVAGIGTAVTAIAAEVGVAVTATALTVGFETIAAVGAVLGVVGQVTHSKVLSYAGLALGAVGGIGALASSAGLLGSGAGMLSEGGGATAATADAASAGTIDSVASAADSAAGLPPELSGGAIGADAIGDGSGLPGGIGAAGGVDAAEGSGLGLGDATKAIGAAKQILPADSNAPDGIDHATGNDAGIKPPSGAAVTPGLNETPVASTTAPAASTLPPPGTPVGAGGSGVVPDMSETAFKTAADRAGMIPTAGDGGTGAFDGILKFANKNPVVALGALQSAGSLLSGMTSTLTPAQVGALNAQAAANDAAAAQQRQLTSNIAGSKAVASSVPVTGQAQIVPIDPRPTAPPAGFINQAPMPPAPITGVAA